VLWSNWSVPSGEHWGVIGAYSQDEGGKAACKTSADAKNKRIAGTELAKVRLFLCLPDTVDPRGPKGSGR
jgi:hypothetical protein